MNFTQWIGKLELEESFEIIKKENYQGISLGYDLNTNIWLITYDSKKHDIFRLIHKLGYVWLWKKHRILDFMKKGPLKKVKEEFHFLYCYIIDTIVNFYLINMDLTFKKELFTYELKRLSHTWNGTFPSEYSLIQKIWVYISAYLTYFNLFPESFQKYYGPTISLFLSNAQTQIMENSKKDLYPLTRETFNNLRKILRKFDSIKNSESHRDIIDYIIQICDTLPYWKREYLIEQFSHYYQ